MVMMFKKDVYYLCNDKMTPEEIAIVEGNGKQ